MPVPILFHSLPIEIHLKILQHLDINSYHNLTATNKYFRSLQSDHLNRYALLYTEYHDPEWFEGRSILPCSICLKVVDQDDCWALHEGVWEFVQEGGPWEAHSLCWECTDDYSGDGDTVASLE
jgi:hypothetical protein